MNLTKMSLGIALLALAASACSHADTQPPRAREIWAVPQVGGISGSPSTCDLGSGLGRAVIVPVSAQVPTPGYVAALRADTGASMWETPHGDTYITYPLCVDVDGDGHRDVLVGVTSGDQVHVTANDLRALAGADGRVLWSLVDHGGAPHGNVYPPVVQAGHEDVLYVAYGGDQYADDTPGIGRTPGGVYAVTLDGRPIAQWVEPEGAEIYSTPAVTTVGGRALLVVGSGGETLTGNLYGLAYDAATAAFHEVWRVSSSCSTGGWIASPVGARDGSGRLLFVGVDYCGVVTAVDEAGAIAWRTQPMEPRFVLSNPAVIAAEQGPDSVVVFYSSFNPADEKATIGVEQSVIRSFDLATGTLRWERALDGNVTSSPVAVDIDDDGVEDPIVTSWRVTTWRPKGYGSSSSGDPPPGGALRVLSGATGAVLFDGVAANMWGTPVVDDLDADGTADIVYTDIDLTNGKGKIHAMSFAGTHYSVSGAYTGFRGAHHDGMR